MILALLIAQSGDTTSAYACDYAYAARINAPIRHASTIVRANTGDDARNAVRRMVEARGHILEGVTCHPNRVAR